MPLTQECIQCCAAMLTMGAEEAGSPAALQLERQIQQFVKVGCISCTLQN